MTRINKIKLRKKVEAALYYLFLIVTVGLFLLFIPLQSRVLHQVDENITYRDTNATGERELLDVSKTESLVEWLKTNVWSRGHGDEY